MGWNNLCFYETFIKRVEPLAHTNGCEEISSFLSILKSNRRSTEKPKNKVKKENKIPPSMTLSDIKLQIGHFGNQQFVPRQIMQKRKEEKKRKKFLQQKTAGQMLSTCKISLKITQNRNFIIEDFTSRNVQKMMGSHGLVAQYYEFPGFNWAFLYCIYKTFQYIFSF